MNETASNLCVFIVIVLSMKPRVISMLPMSTWASRLTVPTGARGVEVEAGIADSGGLSTEGGYPTHRHLGRADETDARGRMISTLPASTDHVELTISRPSHGKSVRSS